MSTLTGTWSLVRLALRLDRVRLPIWIIATVGVALATASSIAQLYPDEASRVRIAGTIGANPALLAIYGPVYSTSIGGVVMWRMAIIGALMAGLMSMLTINRHTRADEETGRLELIGATVVGRHAPMAAALVVTIGADLLLALALAGGLAGQNLPAGGSFAAGFAIGGLGVVLAAVAAVAAQLSENARTVNAISGTVFGVVFVLRLLGDSGDATWLTWLSPVGWISKVEAYGANNYWVLGLMVLLAAALFVVAYVLVGRRDFGAGLLPPRPGPADAGGLLSGPFGLAWRLQRTAMIGWAFGFALMGAVFGSVGTGVLDLLKDNPQMTKIMAQMGGQSVLIDAYMSAVLGLVALVAGVYAVQATLRLRTEETSYRAEPVLATGVSRVRWALSHVVFAVVGVVVMLVIAGLAMGISYGVAVGDVSGQLGSLLRTALVQLPATLVVAGIAVAFFGLAPRFVVGSWAALTLFVLLGQLGPLLQLPQWAMDISPYTHVPRLSGQVTAGPMVWLSAVALALGAVGLAGFRRRDIG